MKSSEPKTDSPARPPNATPLLTLFLGSGAVALLLAIANVASVANSVGVGRIRQFGIFWFSHRLSAFFFDLPLPPLALRAFELGEASSFLSFLFWAGLANLLAAWALATLLAPAVWGAAKLWPSAAGATPSWFWHRAYPLGVLVVFTLPVGLHLIRYQFLRGPKQLEAIVAALAASVVLWLVLLLIFRHPVWLQRFLRTVTLLGFAAALVVAGSGAAAVLLPTTGPAAHPEPAPGLPNILLISIDSLRADHLSCYGYHRETSPAIDQLATEGVLFRTVVAPSSWTLPSHFTLLTSLPPEEHSVLAQTRQLGRGVRSLAAVLRQAGYTTAGIVSGTFLLAEYGFARGFDHYDDYNLIRPWGHYERQANKMADQYKLLHDWLAAWDRNGRQRPFFLFLHIWDVHYDYLPPPPYDTMFDPDYPGTVTGSNFLERGRTPGGLEPRDIEHVVALYDGEIRYTDFYLGKLFDDLKTLGILDNTVVALTADHGEEFAEHGGFDHGKTLYDEVLLVPLILRYPRALPAGKVVERQVRLMDVAPTLLGLAGLKPPANFGTSEPKGPYAEQNLRPWIDHAVSARVLLAFSVGQARDRARHRLRPQASVRSETHKLIKEEADSVAYELYDVVSDPGEKDNVFAAATALAAELEQQLSAWQQVRRAARRESREMRLSEEEKERLRALGYLD